MNCSKEEIRHKIKQLEDEKAQIHQQYNIKENQIEQAKCSIKKEYDELFSKRERDLSKIDRNDQVKFNEIEKNFQKELNELKEKECKINLMQDDNRRNDYLLSKRLAQIEDEIHKMNFILNS